MRLSSNEQTNQIPKKNPYPHLPRNINHGNHRSPTWILLLRFISTQNLWSALSNPHRMVNHMLHLILHQHQKRHLNRHHLWLSHRLSLGAICILHWHMVMGINWNTSNLLRIDHRKRTGVGNCYKHKHSNSIKGRECEVKG